LNRRGANQVERGLMKSKSFVYSGQKRGGEGLFWSSGEKKKKDKKTQVASIEARGRKRLD